jgi:hypothetical protein
VVCVVSNSVEVWKCGSVEMWKRVWKCGSVEMWKRVRMERGQVAGRFHWQRPRVVVGELRRYPPYWTVENLGPGTRGQVRQG